MTELEDRKEAKAGDTQMQKSPAEKGHWCGHKIDEFKGIYNKCKEYVMNTLTSI